MFNSNPTDRERYPKPVEVERIVRYIQILSISLEGGIVRYNQTHFNRMLRSYINIVRLNKGKSYLTGQSRQIIASLTGLSRQIIASLTGQSRQIIRYLTGPFYHGSRQIIAS